MYSFSLNFPNPREVSRVHWLFIVHWKVAFCGDESLGHRLQNRLRVNHCRGNSVRIPVQASCVLLQQIRKPKKALSRELNGAALMRSTVVCAVSSAVGWTLQCPCVTYTCTNILLPWLFSFINVCDHHQAHFCALRLTVESTEQHHWGLK